MLKRSTFGVPGGRAVLVVAVAALVWALFAAFAATFGTPSAHAQGEGKRILFYTGTTGYRHTDGIAGARDNLVPKLRELGYTVDLEDCSGNGTGTNNCNHADKNPRIFSEENLADYDAIVFANMSWSWNAANPGPLMDDAQKDAVIKFVQNGGGIAAIHNATDAGAGRSVWDWWDGGPNSVVGTTMPGHAATNANGNHATVQVLDSNHLSTRDLPDTWQIADEHYNYLTNVRGGHHVLATFDERTYNPGPNGGKQDHPITWCKLYDGPNVNDNTGVNKAYRDGRTWVTGMGHFGVRYADNDNMVKMMLGGIRWVAGEGSKTDCSGTVWSSFKRTVLVADANQPIGIDVAKDGKVYWSELGAIGTAGNDFNSTGRIMMHDQKGAPGNKTTVATIETRADHRLSEDGVLGFTLQPGFDLADPNKRHVFVYYSPRPGANDNWPKGNETGQVVGYNQISRFTLSADGRSVVEGSERVILRVPKAKIAGNPSGFEGGPADNGPGHVGGAGLDFDSEGNLYLGVGDDVSPNAPGHGGYAPMDYRAKERWDARKTSANTADLRGKVLRIRPTLDLIPPGTEPGVGNTYTIPAGNLFPEGTPKTRPEIYAMGFRQPFTLHTDPANPGTVGVGEYCHDASADRADRSPAGVCEWNLLNKPGNHGWPFCTGDNSPFNTMTRWNYAANASTGQKYDCSLDEIPSDIRWAPEGQTPVEPTFDGLDTIPKPEKATIWKKYANAANQGMQSEMDFGDLSEGGMQPIAGPIYRYNENTVSSGGFPAYYDGSWLINNRGSNTGFWKEVKLRRDNNEMLRVHDWLPYNHAGNAANQQNSLVIGTQFGDDGALYMVRYPVTCCRPGATSNTNVQIVKVSFEVYEETTGPNTSVEFDPAEPGNGRTYADPVKLTFSATDVAGEGQIVAGVDYIEHRVTHNGVAGEWVRTPHVGLAETATAEATVGGTSDNLVQGNYVVEYRAVDRGGNASETKTATFTIFRPVTVEQDVHATVPSMLALTIANPASLGDFTPGVAQQYTGTTTATVTSSWANAQLTVHDGTGSNVGRLVNGSAALSSALQAQNASGTFANVSANPLTLASFNAPVSNQSATLTFRQSIAANEALAAGGYSKSLTFTLTTTTP